MIRFLAKIVVAFLMVSSATAQELLPNAMRSKTAAGMAYWNTSGNFGGNVRLIDVKKISKGVRLSSTRIATADGKEIWSGCLKWTRKPIQVVPGLKYSFTVESRGDGDLEIGVFELPWRYSAKIIGTPLQNFGKSDEKWSKRSFEYTPSSDKVMACVPFVKITGWRKILEIRNLSFQKQPANSAVSVTAKDFMRSPGESLEVNIKSSAYPVKLLLYGPDGTSGAGGEMGGSGAWCDHFKSSKSLNGKPNAKLAYDLKIPRNSREGTYRLVVVDPAGNAAATTRFTVRPKKYADEIRALVEKIKLPKGTRIVFLGDSLTDLFRGRNYVSLIERALKWKFGSEVEVINAGVGGDNIIKIQKRLKRDVIDKKPTIVFIFEGANDTKRRYKPALKTLAHWAVPAEKYEKAYREVVGELKTKTKAEIIIATCAPADLDVTALFRKSADTFGISSNFYLLPNEVSKVVAIQKRIAADNALKVIDTNRHLTEYIKANKSSNGKQFATVDDGVHPSEFGNREIARALLEHLENQIKN